MASCRFHCPKIQTWGLGLVPFILFPRGGKKISCQTTGREYVGFVESLHFGVQPSVIYLKNESSWKIGTVPVQALPK